MLQGLGGGGGIDTVFSMKQGPPPGHCCVTGVGGGGGGLWTEYSAWNKAHLQVTVVLQGLGGGGYRYSVPRETRPTSRSVSCCQLAWYSDTPFSFSFFIRFLAASAHRVRGNPKSSCGQQQSCFNQKHAGNYSHKNNNNKVARFPTYQSLPKSQL